MQYVYFFGLQILWYIATTGFRGLTTLGIYRNIFQKYCQELVKATMFQYYNKLNTAVDYCAL